MDGKRAKEWKTKTYDDKKQTSIYLHRFNQRYVFSAKLYNVFGCFTTLNLQSLLSLIDNPNEYVKDCTWFVQNITQICFSWKSACKNTLQRSFSYSVSSKSVSVKASHCSLALTKICSHDWQRRQLIIATIDLANSPPGHFQKLQVVDLAILVLINALDHLVQLLIAQVVAEAHDYLPQLVGCYETVVVLVKRLESLKMILITIVMIMKPCQRP